MNNLKKLLISLLACVSCTSVFAQASAKPQAVSVSFLNNYQWLLVPTNTTVNFNDTNRSVLTYNGWTNVQTLNTNINGNIIGQWESDVGSGNGGAVFADANGNVCSNWAIGIQVNSTNLLLDSKPGGSYPSAPLTWYNTNGLFIYGNVTNVFTNSFGIVSTNISTYYPIPPITPNATSTNVLTLTFAREVLPNVFSTNAVDTFVWAVIPGVNGNSGVSPYMLSTNLPSGFLTGSRKIRLVSIVSAAAPGTSLGELINDIRLFGVSP